jgi:hypothetical protein
MFGLAPLRRAARHRRNLPHVVAACWPLQQQQQQHASFHTSSSSGSSSSSTGKEPETPLLQTIRQRIMVRSSSFCCNPDVFLQHQVCNVSVLIVQPHSIALSH